MNTTDRACPWPKKGHNRADKKTSSGRIWRRRIGDKHGSRPCRIKKVPDNTSYSQTPTTRKTAALVVKPWLPDEMQRIKYRNAFHGEAKFQYQIQHTLTTCQRANHEETIVSQLCAHTNEVCVPIINLTSGPNKSYVGPE